MKKSGLLILLIIMSMKMSIAQMNYWTMPPFKFNMTTAIPTSTALPGGASVYSVSNGAYDENGNLLFYVHNSEIFNSLGVSVGSLIGYTCSTPPIGAFASTQVEIVPIPGTCNKFYVLYSMYEDMGFSRLFYLTVDCSTGSPVIISDPNACGGIQPFTTGHYGNMNVAFAVSKIYTGSGSTAKRFLLSVDSNGEILRSEISATGISTPTVIATFSMLGISGSAWFINEAEISWGSNYFAWNSYENNSIHVIGTTDEGLLRMPIILQNYSIISPKGIEFDNAFSAPKLYATGATGVTQILTSDQTTSAVSTSPYDLSNSYLEFGKNGKIYGISPVYSSGTLTNSYLVGILPSDNSISAVSAGVDSRFTLLGPGFPYNTNVFTLPMQIDGDNYSDFNGYPKVAISSFSINSDRLASLCSAFSSMKDYCQNNPMLFNAVYSGGVPYQYQISLTTMDASCNKVKGTGLISYSGAWTTGNPANLDLRTLTDGAGINLGNTLSRKVRIIYSIKNQCGFISTATGFFNVIAPIPPSITLELYNKNAPQTYLPPSKNISTPVLVGSASLGYRINNSTGTVASLAVTIDEVNSAGTFVQNIYNRTTAVNGVSGLTYENLNNYCINSTVWGFNPGFNNCDVGYAGYSGYFGYTNGQLSYQKYYKLSVTISNSCGSSADWSYIYVNSVNNKMAGVENKDVETSGEKVIIYPNPARNNLTIEVLSGQNESYEIEIFDIVGKQVITVAPEANNGVLFKKDIDISMLQKGTYTYQIKSNKFKKSGVFTKE